MLACYEDGADVCKLLEPLALARQGEKAPGTGGVCRARLIDGQTKPNIRGAVNDGSHALDYGVVNFGREAQIPLRKVTLDTGDAIIRGCDGRAAEHQNPAVRVILK